MLSLCVVIMCWLLLLAWFDGRCLLFVFVLVRCCVLVFGVGCLIVGCVLLVIIVVAVFVRCCVVLVDGDVLLL